jgi:hypothetical protein
LTPLLLVLVAACGGPSVDDRALWDVSFKLTYASVASIGPHHTEATAVHERSGERPRKRTEVFDVRWGDWDNFQVKRSRDGKLLMEHRVIQGMPFGRSGRSGFRPSSDAELFRVELSQTWNALGLALEPFQWQLDAEPDGDAVIEGRPARRYALKLRPLSEGERLRSHVPVSLEGTVVLDAATGVRLFAEAEGRYLEQGREDREWTTRVRLIRSGFGIPPDLLKPEVRE